jgi:hypothetical protein
MLQFEAGNLNFHSSTYERLVVAGVRAQYRGVGTINGAENYGFLLTAIDGQLNGGGGTDKFRIKIWEKTGGIDGDTVYDNQMDKSDTGSDATALGGGSIVIHTSNKQAQCKRGAPAPWSIFFRLHALRKPSSRAGAIPALTGAFEHLIWYRIVRQVSLYFRKMAARGKRSAADLSHWIYNINGLPGIAALFSPAKSLPPSSGGRFRDFFLKPLIHMGNNHLRSSAFVYSTVKIPK